jgi:acyl-CoA reductase-like NAD-dependent aldehyde dehydrogenase
MKADAGKKNVCLELGGNCAVVCEPETDKVFATTRIVFGAFAYSGQTCIGVQRIYLHESIAERMTEMLVAATEKLVVGDPLDEKTDICPLIDDASADRMQEWIKESGGEILCGNRREKNFFWPTLVKNPKAGSKLATQEAFGPVATIESYSDFDDVLARVNNTRFGLQAGVFTNDIRKIRRAFETLEMGSVMINDVPTVRIDNMPYGGIKDSGTGREGIKYAFEHMTERKVLIIRKT